MAKSTCGLPTMFTKWDNDLNPVYETVSANLNNTGKIYIGEDSSKIYALKIVNNTNMELYPSLFYFNNKTIMICEYLPVASM
jgi:outer membrane protein assembly factor BamB